MASRNHAFEIDEYYHCYNRGTEKRVIFNDPQDYSYFLSSLRAYNSKIIRGKLHLYPADMSDEKVVEIVSYCILPNHYHLVLKELVENGISYFMKRVGVGYTMYFNKKYKRSGVLFQGKFKSKYIPSDQDLRQVVSYVTNNFQIHNISDSKLYRSKLNQESDIIRGWTSDNMTYNDMSEIVEIIKELRLSFD